ncbi:hypothetical protein [Paraburkholderia flagellata]|uniref:hypothetical protein n=1 Tax=Paraburkholderia flagellata TaxID=2883241 RepID=UPI001F3F7C96|nr:hypothetical protein [Paraburkholderia flagellata]
MRHVTCVTAFLLGLTVACHAASEQPRKFLVVEPAVVEQWIKTHGAEYKYIWQSRNDGRNGALWEHYAPNTILSSYFPYLRDSTGTPLSEWLMHHPEWVLYRCDGENVAFQFGRPIVPLDIGNPQVRMWQIANFSASWQTDVGIDNFQLGDHERACGIKSPSGTFKPIYSGSAGTERLNSVKLAWLDQVAQTLHRAKKTLTLNYSLDVPAESETAHRIISSVDGVLYEDYWGGEFPKGILTSNSRMLELMKFFSLAQIRQKSVHFIFQLKSVDRPSVQTAMAVYLINSNDRTDIFISAIQHYGIVPSYLGYDKFVGEACGPATIGRDIIVRRFEGADVLLHLPDAAPAVFHPRTGRYADVDGKDLAEDIYLSGPVGLVAYRRGKRACKNLGIEVTEE